MGLLAIAEARLKQRDLGSSKALKKPVKRKVNSTFKKLLRITARKKENLPAVKPKGEKVKTKSLEKKPVKKEISPVKARAQITTVFDELISLVESKGKLDFKAAAKTFGVSEEIIEQWAKILEEHKLLKIYYPPFGKPVMKK